MSKAEKSADLTIPIVNLENSRQRSVHGVEDIPAVIRKNPIVFVVSFQPEIKQDLIPPHVVIVTGFYASEQGVWPFTIFSGAYDVREREIHAFDALNPQRLINQWIKKISMTLNANAKKPEGGALGDLLIRIDLHQFSPIPKSGAHVPNDGRRIRRFEVIDAASKQLVLFLAAHNGPVKEERDELLVA